MKVSVIVINYNNAKYIDKCIKSLIAQSYKNIEIIFIDDNSNDNSLSVVSKYKKKIKIIKKLKKIGKGSFDQMLGFYEGYKNSSGEILFFLDSDDYFHKSKILNVVSEYKNNLTKKIIYDLPIKKRQNFLSKTKIKKSYLFKNYWPFFVPTSCISMKKNFFKKIYKTIDYKFFPNLWFDFRISFSAIYIFKQYNFLKKNLTYYRQTEENISSNFNYLSRNWWKRRLEAHEFVKFFFKKNKINYKKNFDYYLTNFVCFLLK